MKAFDRIQILEVTLTRVGKNAMWDAAMQSLPADSGDRDRPVIARVTDAKGNQICITRIHGIPILVGTSIPERFSGPAIEFQNRWQATPVSLQTVIQVDVLSAT